MMMVVAMPHSKPDIICHLPLPDCISVMPMRPVLITDESTDVAVGKRVEGSCLVSVGSALLSHGSSVMVVCEVHCTSVLWGAVE